MKRIVLHWSGGTHQASEYDRERYHALVEGDGTRVEGHKAPEANLSPLGPDYVRHAGGFNSDAIGMAICSMGGKDVSEKPLSLGKYPPREVQVEELCKWAAEMCHIYGIPVTPDTVMAHSEVKPRFGRGVYKWDINIFPWLTPMQLAPTTAGNLLRKMIQNELNLIENDGFPPVTAPTKPVPSPWVALFVAIASIFGKGGK